MIKFPITWWSPLFSYWLMLSLIVISLISILDVLEFTNQSTGIVISFQGANESLNHILSDLNTGTQDWVWLAFCFETCKKYNFPSIKSPSNGERISLNSWFVQLLSSSYSILRVPRSSAFPSFVHRGTSISLSLFQTTLWILNMTSPMNLLSWRDTKSAERLSLSLTIALNHWSCSK